LQKDLEMGKKRNVDLLNVANENGLLPLIFGGLISADELTSAEQCRKSLEILEGLLEAIPESNIKDKDRWVKFANDGIEIAKQDLKLFINKENGDEER
jgi:hypothetical protein